MTTLIPDIALPRALIRDAAQFRGHVHRDCVTGDLVLRRGRVVGMRPGQAALGTCRLIFPALTEPHCHLDKCHSVGRLEQRGGDLSAAIQAQHRDKANWSADDIRARALRGLAEANAAGVATLRSHVDWGRDAAPPLAWHVLLELAQAAPLTMQLSPLTGINQMADPDFAETVARAVPKGHAIGAMLLGHPHMRAGLRSLFAAAARHDLAVDFHVDEALDPDMNGLEAIADLALETGFGGPILCGHAVSLATRPPKDFTRIADKLARAGIAVVALPATNLYLQGRAPHVPAARGLTPLRALSAAGVRVVVGTDNVRDAFCPVGRHDPLRALELAVLSAQLDPPLGRWLCAITTDARAALGMNPGPIDGAQLHDLRVAQGHDPAALIGGAPHRPATDLLEELPR